MGNKALIGFVVIVVAVLGLPMLMSGSNPTTPYEVVSAFMKASESGVAEDVRPYLTTKSWEKSGSDFQGEPETGEYTVFAGAINGVEAIVPANLDKDGKKIDVTFLLKQEAEKWLIYGMEMSVQGFDITMNFEDPEKMYEELMEQALAMMPAELRSAMTPEVKKQMKEAMKN